MLIIEVGAVTNVWMSAIIDIVKFKDIPIAIRFNNVSVANIMMKLFSDEFWSLVKSFERLFPGFPSQRGIPERYISRDRKYQDLPRFSFHHPRHRFSSRPGQFS